MVRNFITISFFLFIYITTSAQETKPNLEQKANDLYQSQNWEEAANTYEQIVAQDEDNLSAWYRLADSYIQVKHGEKALDALIKASASQQIPRSLIHYQNAQAYYLVADKDSMWQELSLAASTGYGNLALLTKAPIWNEVRNEEKFKNITTVVDSNNRPCIYKKTYKQFDFWLGQWDVYTDLAKTTLAGSNTIEKQQNDCLVSENWISVNGSPGTSMSYYDGTKGKWVQHWVSAGGVVLNMEGGIKEGSMVLQGPIYYEKTTGQKLRTLKGTWTPLENGVVRQYFEESIDQGKTWYPWFEGFYFPKQEEPNKEVQTNSN